MEGREKFISKIDAARRMIPVPSINADAANTPNMSNAPMRRAIAAKMIVSALTGPTRGIVGSYGVR